MELMQVHPLNGDMKNADHIYILTRNGSDYNHEGLEYIENTIREAFETKNNLVAYTGIAVNNPKVLKANLEKWPDSYVVISTRDDVLFLPPFANPDICANIDEKLAEKPDATSWEILMESCKQEIY